MRFIGLAEGKPAVIGIPVFFMFAARVRSDLLTRLPGMRALDFDAERPKCCS
jgi:hypothetical protein